MTVKKKIMVLLKGYPRLSETFIAQELLGLEKAGLELGLVSMRRPTDKKRHPVHDEIRANVTYLPEYLHEEPLRVLKALWSCRAKPGFGKALRRFARDLRHDVSRNRFRRFGQAAVLAHEWPVDAGWLHVHFIHTPASVAAYTHLITGTPWTISAHAKDIWTSSDHDLSNKLDSARWAVTCTASGFRHLQNLSSDKSKVHLSYHGLDLTRFPHFEGPREERDGSHPSQPVRVLSVGRAVKKKGIDILLHALAALPSSLHWRFTHIGGGDELSALKTLADELGVSDRIEWMGAMDQTQVLEHYRKADLFALACRITSDGDRDGLPNVLVEAASQNLTCISTNISGIPEFFIDGENGLLTEPDDATAFSQALQKAMTDPALRGRLGAAAENRVRTAFDHRNSITELKALFEQEWEKDL
ncbi:glycosyltransferase involved in cell wall biosynthesis [Rhizobium skierniewicense]|uniref:Glycosyltransferase involved in cell wall biosynthesis n=1 Tax=Rhizobium skierniewicense TaxID=984260 RepID=A0A7W6C5U6_9HYPH|nr:glycosyltransferase family 4 protein [Rhizobium skierniewicense]MBB3946298.1 glycosyltransferase involved in cell wall biosynthesis [Rhizobium skierniewicense]